MEQGHSLEYYEPRHDLILQSARMSGCDIGQKIQGATRLIGYGNTIYGYGPACLIDLVSTEHVYEPHVTWFPWTSAADKIKNFKWAMNLMAIDHEVLLHIEKKQKLFFDHFVKKNFLRKIGFIENLPIVEEIHMYQVKRRKI